MRVECRGGRSLCQMKRMEVRRHRGGGGGEGLFSVNQGSEENRCLGVYICKYKLRTNPLQTILHRYLVPLRIRGGTQPGVWVFLGISYTHCLLRLPLVRLHFGLQLVHQVLEPEDILAVFLSLQTECL